MANVINSYIKGVRDGIPIALGYLSVSFTFGMMATEKGVPTLAAVLISMTNLTSAGQFAGLGLIVSGGTLLEMALTQLVINLRYALMSVSLSQKLDKGLRFLDRLAIAFGVTDEIFAVAMNQDGKVGKKYLFGLIAGPYLGWTLGTLTGTAASALLPLSLRSALGIAIYGMFLAIIVPPAKKSRPVLAVVLLAAGISCLFYYIPQLKSVSSGFVIIIAGVAASLLGALVAPIKDSKGADTV